MSETNNSVSASCSSVWVVISGVVYESHDIVAIYTTKSAAEKRRAKIEKEQERYRRLLQTDDPGEWEKRNWSSTAYQDYAEVQRHNLRR